MTEVFLMLQANLMTFHKHDPLMLHLDRDLKSRR